MKFSSLQQDLLPSLQTVSRSVGMHGNLPVLGNILISAADNKLKIAATNLEIGVIKNINAKVTEPGEITIPAKTLVELINGLGDLDINFESKGDNLEIESGNFKAKINGISANEFPAIPVNGDQVVSFRKEILKKINEVLFAAAIDEGRPTLTGVLIESTKESLNFVATDGFRLAHKHLKVEKNSSFKSLIPKRTFEEVLRILDEEDVEDVEISTSKDQNQIIFKIGNVLISSRLIEGNFPSWEKIIPTDIKTRVIVERSLFFKAIKLASVFAKGEANVVTLNPGTGKISITSEAKELGNQQNEVEAEVSGENFGVSFNAKFLQDLLQAVSAQQILMELSGPLSATLIKPMGVEGLEYILMPVRTN